VKALSVMQPYATLLAIGVKSIETRSWKTPYRGLLAVHASQTIKREYRERCLAEPFRSVLLDAGYASWQDLPRGVVLATARLIDCIPTEVLVAQSDVYLPGNEQAFGFYDPHRYGWLLENVEPLPQPIQAVGRLGLWEWNP
jgi:hypothetical protein